jgi:hypothetical protein
MTVAAARVDVLTAEVRALMVGSRQVTLSVYRQLDATAAHAAYLDAIAEIRRHTPRRPQPGPRSSDWNQPSSYELTPAELRREIERCIAAGWQPWEIATRFVDPDTAPEPTR